MAERCGERATYVAVHSQRTLIRSGLRAVLAQEPDIEVVAEVGYEHLDDPGRRAVVDTLEVDVAVIDLDAPPVPVDVLVGAIRRRRRRVAIIGVHGGRRSDHVAAAATATVDSLVSRSTGASGVLTAIRGGEPHDRHPDVERRMLPGREVLTAREQEVLRHISAGLTTAQSAQLLQVSPKTVDNHKQRMFVKLQVQNQAHAVAVAHRAGILGAPDPERAVGA
jgi:DNA-binding NarL/FixJ family response regulator